MKRRIFLPLFIQFFSLNLTAQHEGKIELKRILFSKNENIKTVLFAVVAVATAASYGRK